MRIVDLYWLPTAPDFAEHLRRNASEEHPDWDQLVRLANSRLDFVKTNRLDRALQRCAIENRSIQTVKLAVLSSSTADHLLAGCRVAAARRNFRLQTYVASYGMYLQELQDAGSALRQFEPDVLLFAFHSQHLLGNPDPTMTRERADARLAQAADRVATAWQLARSNFRGQIIQQPIAPVQRLLMGANEHRLPGSVAWLVERLNARLRTLADEHRVDMLALDRVMLEDGVRAWHDPVLWHRAKQEISPVAAPAYGDMVARLVAAQQGRSSKCLVLDLDNTLWGGVIGDDGLEGIKLGQGSAIGEAYLDFQRYVRDLGLRGIILAVCSKNDPENARAPFECHPEMILKSDHIACFVANWNDKPANLRAIAAQLNIGIDSLVFVDDNPFERNIVRRELPAVAVPEMPDDPAYYGRCLADGGYFEALQLTGEDFDRGVQYRANILRDELRASQTDLGGYLQGLDMELRWQPFDHVGLQRIVQLINKTNQFNLTTRRYSEDEILGIMQDIRCLTLQLRLLDQFGDNGIIGVVIGKPQGDSMLLDTWLMSCRVLGRQVEEATMNVVASEARRLGSVELIGEYLSTKKNSMVRDHYQKLGFQCITADDCASKWSLSLAGYTPFSTFINLTRST
jgi:FkbH-like protein